MTFNYFYVGTYNLNLPKVTQSAEEVEGVKEDCNPSDENVKE